MAKLSHTDDKGQAQMVDVSGKDVTARRAVAQTTVLLKADTLTMITDGSAPKGDVLAVARIAGIQAGKKTSDLIPLCHPLPLSKVSVDFEIDKKGAAIHVIAEARTTGQTGVEMEALTAASIAALTIYDMVKAVQKDVKIADLHLVHKSGGKSGDFNAK